MNSVEYSCSLCNSDGHILEFGVYQGGTISQIRNLVKNDVFGFDSFEGLPSDWEGTVCSKGFFSTNGNIPDVEGVTFYKGWFNDTLPEYLKVAKDISLLHIDCDLYESTKCVFEALDKYIVSGTIICFDEWVYTKSGGEICGDHEQKYFYEWVENTKRKYEFVDFVDNTPCGFERKIVKII